MSTVSEIEAAIEHLPAREMLKVAEWLEDYRSTILASESMCQRLDTEDGGEAGSQWQGE
jgi:hypothetical protein